MIYIPETTVSGFEHISDGIYNVIHDHDNDEWYDALKNALTPNDGDTFPCIVVWDGVRYETEMLYLNSIDVVGFFIGNMGLVGWGVDNGQPFVVGVMKNTDTIITNQEGESHTFFVGDMSEGMPSHAIIPTADYKAACDFIRSKTGKTDKIKSGDMVAEMEEAFVIGGSETHKTVAIDYTDFDNGTFNETLDNGMVLTYTVEFVDGKAVSIIIPNGKVIPIHWETTVLVPTILLEGFDYVQNVEKYQHTFTNEHGKLLYNSLSAVTELDTVVEVNVVFDGVKYKTHLEHSYDDMEGANVLSFKNDAFNGYVAQHGFGAIFTVLDGDSHTISIEMEE